MEEVSLVAMVNHHVVVTWLVRRLPYHLLGVDGSTGDVVVTTSQAGTDAGDITVAQSLAWANASSLTLNADRDITVNSGVSISNTGSGNLRFRADSAGTGTGTVNLLGAANVDYQNSTGQVSIFYNPSSYATPTDYTGSVLTNGAVSNQLTAYMLVNNVFDLQNLQQNLGGNYALGRPIDATITSTWNSV